MTGVQTCALPICLITAAPAPTFRPCPSVDAVTPHGTYEYQQSDDPAANPDANPPNLLVGIPGLLTICGQTFYRQDTATHTTEKDKFKIIGLELFELIMSKISLTSKLIAKTQPGYLQAVQANCPHCSLTRRTVRSRTVLRVILLTIRFIVYVCVVIEFMVLIIPCYHISYL